VVFLLQEKQNMNPSGFPLGKYDAVQRDQSRVDYSTKCKIIPTFPHPNCSLTIPKQRFRENEISLIYQDRSHCTASYFPDGNPEGFVFHLRSVQNGTEIVDHTQVAIASNLIITIV
jgi:hypothetical protein